MPRFTPGELAVMRILWEHGELKPAEIQKEFPRQIKNPALRSYLAILVEKGHVTRRRRGRAFYYRAKTRRESTFRTMLRDLVDSCCEGSTEALLCRLIQMEKLSESELIELRRVADGDAAEPPSEQGESE
jgi:predicted transcriptional regulator